MKNLRWGSLLLIVPLSTACTADRESAPVPPPAPTEEAQPQGGEHSWGYEGESGPAHWSEMGYPGCAGETQSPIAIPADASVQTADILFRYEPTLVNIVNNGHTVQVNYDEGSTIEVEGQTYQLLQFHFHALSEHTIHGEHSDMEMHLVHQSVDGKYAVVAVMIEPGTDNAAYDSVWGVLPAAEGEAETISGVSVNAADLLPGERGHYRYNGSFTTPPCTEGVMWLVLSTPVELSDTQIAAFKSIYDGNYRPVQPLNEREID